MTTKKKPQSGLDQARELLSEITREIPPPFGERHALTLGNGSDPGMMLALRVGGSEESESRCQCINLDEADLTKEVSVLVREILALWESRPR